MSSNAFLSFFDKAGGESAQKGKEKWVEVDSWGWEVEADTNWTTGSGASVGKPIPGSFSWEHDFDAASIVIMGYLCTGAAFPKVQLQLLRSSQGHASDSYFTATMEGVFITKVSHGGTDDGNVHQRVEMVFKTINIEYKQQDRQTGQFGKPQVFSWDIPAGTASPSS